MWDIYLETKSVTTARCVARTLTEMLFKTNSEKNTDSENLLTQIDPNISVHSVPSLGNYQGYETRYIIPASEWFPGFFSRNTVQLSELLKSEDIRLMVKLVPERFTTLIHELVDHELVDRGNKRSDV